MKELSEEIRVAIVGYGNVGRGVMDAVEVSPDMELAGIVTRRKKDVSEELPNVDVVSDVKDLYDVKVAALCIPSEIVPEVAPEVLKLGMNTVDCFDMHRDRILELYKSLDKICKEYRTVAMIGFGWDPGIDSMIRAIFKSTIPYGVTDTDFGPGMSMGHSAVVRRIPGVRDAVSITKPKGGGRHLREVYVVLEQGADFERIRDRIVHYPFYFEHDETYVTQVTSLDDYEDTGHGGVIIRRGRCGKTSNQFLQYKIRVDNPKVTGQIMVSAARASTKLSPGAYTPIDVPLNYFLPGSIEDLIKKLV